MCGLTRVIEPLEEIYSNIFFSVFVSIFPTVNNIRLHLTYNLSKMLVLLILKRCIGMDKERKNNPHLGHVYLKPVWG